MSISRVPFIVCLVGFARLFCSSQALFA